MTQYEKNPGFVRWTIIDKCNYRCSYCLTPDHCKATDIRVDDHRKYISAFKRIFPSGWNFDLVGGEPTLHPDFLGIVKDLVDNEYTVSLASNFTLSKKDLVKFFEITGKNCFMFKASMHLEYTSVYEYLEKLLFLKERFPNARIFSVSVGIPENLQTILEVAKKVNSSNIEFIFQSYRDKKTNKRFQYSEEEQKTINKIIKFSGIARKRGIGSYYKVKDNCYCGYKFMQINPYGDVFRCQPYKKKNESLGNIADNNFKLQEGPAPCSKESCYCGESTQIMDFMNYKRCN